MADLYGQESAPLSVAGSRTEEKSGFSTVQRFGFCAIWTTLYEGHYFGTLLGPNNVRTGIKNASLKQGTFFMGIQHLSDRALLVTLPREPQSGAELQAAAGMVGPNRVRHIIVDFSLVEFMPSEVICNLIVLSRLLEQIDRQLVLCSVGSQIKDVFRRVELTELFRFADDEFAALQSLDRCLCHG